MKPQIRIASLSLTILCLVLAAIPATAGTLYDNGPINGNVNSWDITRGSGNAVSDSFFLTAAMSGVESVHFGEWTQVEARPYTVDWEIGTAPFTANGGRQVPLSLPGIIWVTTKDVATSPMPVLCSPPST